MKIKEKFFLFACRLMLACSLCAGLIFPTAQIPALAQGQEEENIVTYCYSM